LRNSIRGGHRSRKCERLHRRNGYSTFCNAGPKTQLAHGIFINLALNRSGSDEKPWPQSRFWSDTVGSLPSSRADVTGMIGESYEGLQFIQP
jgi:hypothetical protein